MTTTCLACGAVSEDDDRFCSSCGAGLNVVGEPTGIIPIVSDNDTGEIRTLSGDTALDLTPGSALLVVRRGPLEGVRFTLEAGVEYSVGRSPESSIFLDDVTVSRNHAVLAYQPEGWRITDSTSLNGTYVNRNRVDVAILANEDEVQIGKYRFAFLTVLQSEN